MTMTLDPSVANAAVFELATLLDLIGDEEPEMLQQVVTMFIEDSSSRINALRDAAVAQNQKTYDEQSHSLKGSAAYAGATQLHTLAKLANNTVRQPSFSWPELLQYVDEIEVAYQRFQVEAPKILNDTYGL